MGRSLTLAAGALLLPGLAILGPAAATARASDFVPVPGTYQVDTDDLLISGPGGGDVGHLVGGVAVFDFDDVVIPSGTTLLVTGSRPVRFVALGRMEVRGVISAKGSNASDGGGALVPGGPGGSAGGLPSEAGSGPGGGEPGNSSSGAGGGGYGGRGADGGAAGGSGGPEYIGVPTVLEGGSGGGGSAITSGGGGGGAVELQATQLTIAPSGLVSVDGGGGAVAAGGGTGGGSGGGLILRADTLSVQGALLARGGDGGAGGCCGDGGGGAGGRVALSGRRSLDVATAPLVTGGTSGVRTTGGCCAPGSPSPDPTGLVGQVIEIRGTTLKASADRVTAPRTKVALTTKLRSFTTPLAGQTVTLWRRPLDGSSWQRVATRATNATGAASARLRVSMSGRYQWRFAGTPTFLSSKSPQSTVTVRR